LSPPGLQFPQEKTDPRAPHFAHATLLANHGTSVSSGYFETSISPSCRHDGLRQEPPLHPERAHIAERHRRSRWLLHFVASMG
jgi:hypothetical protein